MLRRVRRAGFLACIAVSVMFVGSCSSDEAGMDEAMAEESGDEEGEEEGNVAAEDNFGGEDSLAGENGLNAQGDEGFGDQGLGGNQALLGDQGLGGNQAMGDQGLGGNQALLGNEGAAPAENAMGGALANTAPVNTAMPAPQPTALAPVPVVAGIGGEPAGVGLPELGSKMPYIVVPGDTLAKIAGKIYGQPERYQELATLSNIEDPNWIHPGDIVYYQLLPEAVAFASQYEVAPYARLDSTPRFAQLQEPSQSTAAEILVAATQQKDCFDASTQDFHDTLDFSVAADHDTLAFEAQLANLSQETLQVEVSLWDSLEALAQTII